MGFFGSDEETIEEKAIDTSGHVNNNIIIQEAKDTHGQLVISEKLLFGTYVLITIESIKLAICIISAFKRNIKKKYLNNANV